MPRVGAVGDVCGRASSSWCEDARSLIGSLKLLFTKPFIVNLSPEGKKALKDIRKVQQSLWEGIPGVAFDIEE